MNTLPSMSEMEAALARADPAGLVPVRAAVLRNVMVESLTPFLRYLALERGLDARVAYGEYDNVFQEAVGGRADLLGPETDAVLVFEHLETLSPDLAERFNALDAEAVARESERVLEHCAAVLDGIRAQTGAMVLWHGFEPRLYPAAGVYDSQDRPGQNRAGQNAAIATLNAGLRSLLAGRPDAYFTDMGLLLARVGARDFHDARFWHLGRAPYGRAGLAEIAREDVKFLAALKGRNRKCLVLDCDNTLWGGVVGEDGVSGIRLGPTHPGSPFLDLQREILTLQQRGVILALNSKNNEADVWEVFDTHPDMVLKREHVAAWRINWNDKAANLRELAAELNIGLEHMVFADDSEFEIELVRSELPQVAVLHLPKNDTPAHRERLASCGLFDTLTISAEDRARGAMYRAEAGRRRLRAEATDMEGYYRNLEMALTVRYADAFTLPRAAQMTQKTNQFNLTTRRYSEADMTRFAASPDHDVVHVAMADRFGDSGLVGLAVVAYADGSADLDTFLLSCRALGRGVERALLAFAARRARSRGCARLTGSWLRTAKNAQVERFYADNGFALVHDDNGQGRKDFCLELADETALPAAPAFFAAIDQPDPEKE